MGGLFPIATLIASNLQTPGGGVGRGGWGETSNGARIRAYGKAYNFVSVLYREPGRKLEVIRVVTYIPESSSS